MTSHPFYRKAQGQKAFFSHSHQCQRFLYGFYCRTGSCNDASFVINRTEAQPFLLKITGYFESSLTSAHFLVLPESKPDISFRLEAFVYQVIRSLHQREEHTFHVKCSTTVYASACNSSREGRIIPLLRISPDGRQRFVVKPENRICNSRRRRIISDYRNHIVMGQE